MIDSHCHLADDAFEADLSEVIHRAREGGLSDVLCVVDASDADEAQRLVRVKSLWPGVLTAAGVHPHRASTCEDSPDRAARLTLDRVRVDRSVRAIGEIGLDYHYDFSPRGVQRAVFAAQVALAREVNLPIVIHTREADADTFSILEEAGAGKVRGVFHCFSGDAAMAQRAVSMGFHVSFSGIVTFPKGAAIREAAAIVPLDRLLAETDCPYLAPVPMRGKRNEPVWVRYVIDALAAVRGLESNAMEAALTGNFHALFRREGGERSENARRIDHPAR